MCNRCLVVPICTITLLPSSEPTGSGFQESIWWLEMNDSSHFLFVCAQLKLSFIVSVWCSHQFQSKLQAQGEQMTVPRKDQRPASPTTETTAPISGPEPFDRHNIGSRLRAAREAKGLSLSQLADQTRVRISALEAIEAGDFERLPEPIYVQSYLRAFAQAVEIGRASCRERVLMPV